MSTLFRKFAGVAAATIVLLSNAGVCWSDEVDDKNALEAQRQAIENEDKAALEAQRLAIESEATAPDSKNSSGPLLKGGLTYCVPQGTPLKLKLSEVPSLGMKMLDRDMDGNLHPAQVNQEITAKTTEDIFVEDNKVIPEGTIFHGKVSQVIAPKRVGRPGSLVLSFDHFKLPDGRRFAFRAEANNAKQSTAKTKAKGFGLIVAHAAGGAVVGAMIAYQLFGMEQTIAMHGYNIAGGAAAGALMGTAVAIMRHGPQATLEPGDDLNMAIDTDLLLPAATSPTIKPPTANLPGVEIQVLKTKMMKDGLDGHQFRVDMVVTNNTHKRLQSIDLFIEDDNGSRFPVVGDVETDKTEILFDIDPLSSRRVMCDFQYEFPKLKRKLVWIDHKTRQPLVTQKLP